MPRKIPQILTVDDDEVTCELLCEVFSREGFGAAFVNSGEAALAELAQQRPDLLLMIEQLLMQDLDAFSFWIWHETSHWKCNTNTSSCGR